MLDMAVQRSHLKRKAHRLGLILNCAHYFIKLYELFLNTLNTYGIKFICVIFAFFFIIHYFRVILFLYYISVHVISRRNNIFHKQQQ